jgi:DNA primase
MLDNASSFSGFMLGTLEERNDITTAEGRAQFLAQARPLIQAMPEIALKLQLQRQVALKSAVSDAELQQFLSVKQTNGYVPAPIASSSAVDPQEGMPADAPIKGRQFTPKKAWTKDWQKPDRLAIGAIRSKAAPVKLIRRSYLLTLLHPSLAKETLEKLAVDKIPDELHLWITALATCNEGSFAGLCDVLRAQFPAQIAEVEIDAASDKALIAEMSYEEAYSEYLDSIHKLRARQLRQESNDLMMKININQASPEDMQRYREVMVVIAKLHPSE